MTIARDVERRLAHRSVLGAEHSRCNVEQRGGLDIEQCTVLYRAVIDIIALRRELRSMTRRTSSEVASCAVAAVLMHGSVSSMLVTKHGLVSIALQFNVMPRSRGP